MGDRRSPPSARAGSDADFAPATLATAPLHRAPSIRSIVIVVVVVAIGAIGVAAMVVSVIGDGISNRRASNAAHDRADRAADDGPGNCAANSACDQAVLIGKGHRG